MLIYKLAQSILPYNRLLIGFSGGLDSTVLMHRLKLLSIRNSNIKLRALHVNYGLSPNADNWTEHCSALCCAWKIPLLIIRASLSREEKNIEALARKVRYTSFKKSLLDDEAVVTAHHIDDQCETLLLALKRGSGPAGLSSMSMCSKFSNTHLLRPMLDETRRSIKFWARTYSLQWIEDESNKNDYYDRNFIRLRIIPVLNNRWPNISTTIARSAILCAEQESLLNELLSDELVNLISIEGALKIAPLTLMSNIHRSALLRRWISNIGEPKPSRLMLNLVWQEVAKARKDAVPCIKFHSYEIRRFKGMLWKVRSHNSFEDMIFIWHNPYETLILPPEIGHLFFKKGGNIRLPLLQEVVSIRFKASGILHIVGRHGGRKLKKIWQELNIPPWERKIIPLLFYNETLIAALGKFITREGWAEKGVFLEKKS